MNDLLPNVTRANLSSSKEARAVWAMQHSLKYMQIRSGELLEESTAARRIEGANRQVAAWFDALPDNLAEITGSIDNIESHIILSDVMREMLAERLADAMQDEARKAGYGRDVVFVDELNEPVDPLGEFAGSGDVHLYSPSVFYEDRPAYLKFLMSRVYGSPFDMMAKVVQAAISPPERIGVDESAKRHLRFSVAGGVNKSYDPELTPMMVEPMRATTSRHVKAVTYVGPAQSGKTAALVDAVIVHNIATEPTDLMLVQPAQSSASDYATRRLDRMIDASPELSRLALATTSKLKREFLAGNRVDVTWPSINTLSGKAIPIMLLTDFDRFDLDLRGEGNPYEMAAARPRTFRSRGTIVAETSPGYDVDPDAPEPTGHYAPTTLGLLANFNLGSRARWYVACLHCDTLFEFANRYLNWPEVGTNDVTIEQAAKQTRLACPHCGSLHMPNQKAELNARGQWVHEAPDSDHRSFWQQGASAQWSTWYELVTARLLAEKHATDTGDFTKLKGVINIDWAEPFAKPIREIDAAAATTLQESATANPDTDLVKKQLPPQAGLILTTVDTQNRRFVVQVHAVGMGGEMWVIDRFNISRAKRVGDDGKELTIAPNVYAEDWVTLDSLHNKEYKDGDRVLKPSAVCIDSGGNDATTSNAYLYWRRCQRLPFGNRVVLLKGYTPKSSTRNLRTAPPRVHMTIVDKGAGKQGVPLWVLNTNQLKDEVHTFMRRTEAGPNTIHMPAWASAWWFNELVAEERTDAGWKKIKEKSNNEGFDLLYYARAAYIIMGGDKGKLDSAMPAPVNWTEAALDSEGAATAETSNAFDFEALGRASRG